MSEILQIRYCLLGPKDKSVYSMNNNVYSTEWGNEKPLIYIDVWVEFDLLLLITHGHLKMERVAGIEPARPAWEDGRGSGENHRFNRVVDIEDEWYSHKPFPHSANNQTDPLNRTTICTCSFWNCCKLLWDLAL